MVGVMLYYFYSLTLRGLDISTSLLGVLNIHIRHLTTLLAKKKTICRSSKERKDHMEKQYICKYNYYIIYIILYYLSYIIYIILYYIILYYIILYYRERDPFAPASWVNHAFELFTPRYWICEGILPGFSTQAQPPTNYDWETPIDTVWNRRMAQPSPA